MTDQARLCSSERRDQVNHCFNIPGPVSFSSSFSAVNIEKLSDSLLQQTDFRVISTPDRQKYYYMRLLQQTDFRLISTPDRQILLHETSRTDRLQTNFYSRWEEILLHETCTTDTKLTSASDFTNIHQTFFYNRQNLHLQQTKHQSYFYPLKTDLLDRHHKDFYKRHKEQLLQHPSD